MKTTTVYILFYPIRSCLFFQTINYVPSMQMQRIQLLLTPSLVTSIPLFYHLTLISRLKRVDTKTRKKQKVQLEGKFPQKQKDFFHAKTVVIGGGKGNATSTHGHTTVRTTQEEGSPTTHPHILPNSHNVRTFVIVLNQFKSFKLLASSSTWVWTV